MSKELIYQFKLRGQQAEVNNSDIAMCFPSISGDGSYFFTLNDGTRFRGEEVKEVMRDKISPLITL
ncbi:hypothetical protein [Pantoea endophytica]|uniref:hypothetical protein n=1 Tax=Pantoea endophytica TaxID=92488 RepID=UPI001AE13E36|nr:hypothetical protein [Pantoea endophytica]